MEKGLCVLYRLLIKRLNILKVLKKKRTFLLWTLSRRLERSNTYAHIGNAYCVYEILHAVSWKKTNSFLLRALFFFTFIFEGLFFQHFCYAIDSKILSFFFQQF